MPTILGSLNLNAPFGAEKELQELSQAIPERPLLKKIFSRNGKPQDDGDKIGKQITTLKLQYKEDKKFLDKVSKVEENYKKCYGKDPANPGEVDCFGKNILEKWNSCNSALEEFERNFGKKISEYEAIANDIEKISEKVNNIKNIGKYKENDAILGKKMEDYNKELEIQNEIVRCYKEVKSLVSGLLQLKFELKTRRMNWGEACKIIEACYESISSKNKCVAEFKDKKLDIKELINIKNGIDKNAEEREEFEEEFLKLYAFDDNMGLPKNDSGREYASKELKDIKEKLRTINESYAEKVRTTSIGVREVVLGKKNVEIQYDHTGDWTGPQYILVNSKGKQYKKYTDCLNRIKSARLDAENEATEVLKNLWKNRGVYVNK